MWQKTMKVVQVQHKCAKALVEQKKGKETSMKMTTQEKQDMNELAFSLLILNLSDNILMQVNEEEITAKVWSKLESLYITKSLSNKITLYDVILRWGSPLFMAWRVAFLVPYYVGVACVL